MSALLSDCLSSSVLAFQRSSSIGVQMWRGAALAAFFRAAARLGGCGFDRSHGSIVTVTPRIGRVLVECRNSVIRPVTPRSWRSKSLNSIAASRSSSASDSGLAVRCGGSLPVFGSVTRAGLGASAAVLAPAGTVLEPPDALSEPPDTLSELPDTLSELPDTLSEPADPIADAVAGPEPIADPAVGAAGLWQPTPSANPSSPTTSRIRMALEPRTPRAARPSLRSPASGLRAGLDPALDRLALLDTQHRSAERHDPIHRLRPGDVSDRHQEVAPRRVPGHHALPVGQGRRRDADQLV